MAQFKRQCNKTISSKSKYYICMLVCIYGENANKIYNKKMLALCYVKGAQKSNDFNRTLAMTVRLCL